ncbi:MAG: hypothetical protein UZ13_02825 [Chloroflexi bacterium OLB13]|nr:MAG: hypothetical protein UZ13_02825 [Chloroflexi bacterium OLB13]
MDAGSSVGGRTLVGNGFGTSGSAEGSGVTSCAATVAVGLSVGAGVLLVHAVTTTATTNANKSRVIKRRVMCSVCRKMETWAS